MKYKVIADPNLSFYTPTYINKSKIIRIPMKKRKSNRRINYRNALNQTKVEE